ncbi:MAG: type II toxin-antitoxin system VapC family toxin [Acidobacteria bacterium]|nr:type II toxin-antitoxin system VapC family toxin [Acidobacteriota bacterium]
MIRYFDASALVKRYVREPGSSTVRRCLRSDRAVTSRLSEVEVVSALARLTREKAISDRERDRGLQRLADDFQRLWVVELIPEVVTLARALLARRALRAADAIQLASCLYIRNELSEPVPLVVYDDRLANAAIAEGVLVTPRRRRRVRRPS